MTSKKDGGVVDFSVSADDWIKSDVVYMVVERDTGKLAYGRGSRKIWTRRYNAQKRADRYSVGGRNYAVKAYRLVRSPEDDGE